MTAEDVQRVAGEYLKRNKLNVGWYLPGGDQALPAEGDGAGADGEDEEEIDG